MQSNSDDDKDAIPINWSLPRIFEKAQLQGARYALDRVWQAERLPEHLICAVPKRQAEYMAVRWCASLLYQQFNLVFEPSWPASHIDRSPIWPEGWLGSLTHASGYAIAVMASEKHVCAVGVDVEPIISEKTASKVHQYILHPNDQVNLNNLKQVTLAFSFKESFYKALNPILKRFIGFQELCIEEIDSEMIHFSVQGDLRSDFPTGFPLQGRYLLSDELVVTAYEAIL